MSQKGDSVGTDGTTYLVKELGKKKVGLIGTNESYGLSNIASSTAALKSFKLKPFAVRKVSPAATDLTPQVLAMKGADALGDWSFPNVLGVQMNESLQNGISVPTVTGSGGLIAASYGLVQPDALPDLYAVSSCDPAATNATAKLKSFVSDYKAKYDSVPSNYAPLAYDAVYFAVAAVNSAKSTSADKIKSAMEKVNYTGGVCAPAYKSDAAHVLIHQNQISHFAKDGTSEVVAKYQIPPAK
jgi:branched-chain amino acid transport system substrate-binding protein